MQHLPRPSIGGSKSVKTCVLTDDGVTTQKQAVPASGNGLESWSTGAKVVWTLGGSNAKGYGRSSWMYIPGCYLARAVCDVEFLPAFRLMMVSPHHVHTA